MRGSSLMRSRRLWIVLAIVGLGLAAALLAGLWTLRAMREPEFWESAIVDFEEQDALHPPQPGAIVFTGSSSIRMWQSLSRDMAPLPVLNRGFGGSHIAHVNYYLHRIVLPYRPRGVVLYAGDNDLASGSGKTPESVLADFQRFVAGVHAELPETPIWFLSIKPSKSRWDRWPLMRRANELIAGFAAATPKVDFIDVATPMLGEDGKPRDLFIIDGLHLNERGYALWTSLVRPVLMRQWPAEGTASP